MCNSLFWYSWLMISTWVTNTGYARCTFHQGWRSPKSVDEAVFTVSPSTALPASQPFHVLLWVAGRERAKFVRPIRRWLIAVNPWFKFVGCVAKLQLELRFGRFIMPQRNYCTYLSIILTFYCVHLCFVEKDKKKLLNHYVLSHNTLVKWGMRNHVECQNLSQLSPNFIHKKINQFWDPLIWQTVGGQHDFF